MDVYDAKQPQTCLICGFTIDHNKQGRFTSHLKNEHNLTLDNYLISYFYPIEMVTCQYILCHKKVKLRRGIPNKFCSRSCRGKGEPLTCVICGRLFDENIARQKRVVENVRVSFVHKIQESGIMKCQMNKRRFILKISFQKQQTLEK